MRSETGAERTHASGELPGSRRTDLFPWWDTEASTARTPRSDVHPTAPRSMLGRNSGVPALSRAAQGRKASKDKTRITVSLLLVFYTPLAPAILRLCLPACQSSTQRVLRARIWNEPAAVSYTHLRAH